MPVETTAPKAPAATHPADESVTSEVSGWLQEHGHPELADAFEKAGYRYLADLKPEAIKKALSGQPPGVVAELVRLRSDDLEEAKPLAAPTLKPAREFELAVPDFPDKGSMSLTLPDLGFVPGTDTLEKVVSAAELTAGQWLALTVNSNMLVGLDLIPLFEGRSSKPEECFLPALMWRAPESPDFYNCAHLSARIHTEVVETAQSASMVASGFTSIDAEVTSPWVSASVRYDESHSQATAEKSKTFYVIGLYDFDRVRIDLAQCTAVSPRFVSAVKAALASTNPKAALGEVFQQYGQVIGRQVTLGGRLYFVHTRDEKENVSKETIKVQTSAAIAGAYAGFGGSASASVGNAGSNQASAFSMEEKISFQAIGGDVTLANEPERWKNTIKNPAAWEVIRFDKLQYTVDLLDAPLRELVLKVWQNPRFLEKRPTGLPSVRLEKTDASVPKFTLGLDGVPATDLSLQFWFRPLNSVDPVSWLTVGQTCTLDDKVEYDFVIKLEGRYAGIYELHYRDRCRPDAWVRGGATARIAGARLDDLEICVSYVGGGVITIPARECDPASKKYIPNEDASLTSVAGGSLSYLHIVYNGPGKVRRRLEAVFAAAQSRPVRVEFNGLLVAESALAGVTGGWTRANLVTERIGAVELASGINTLVVTRSAGSGPHLQEFRLVPEEIDIPAASFVASPARNLAVCEFDFRGTRPTPLVLEAVYASADSRPVNVTLNDVSVFTQVLAEATGGQYKAVALGTVNVRAGKNTLVIETDKVIPALRELRLVPENPYVDLPVDA